MTDVSDYIDPHDPYPVDQEAIAEEHRSLAEAGIPLADVDPAEIAEDVEAFARHSARLAEAETAEEDLDHGGIRHLRLDGKACPSGRPYPHTADAHCRPNTGHHADFTLPTVARLRQQLADEQATHAKTISNFEEFAESAVEHQDKLRAQLAAAEARAAAASSVPHAAREAEAEQYRREIAHIRDRFLRGRQPEETFTVGELLAVFRNGPGRLADEHAARQVISPGHPVAADEWPVDGAWGPYEHERETRLEPMPVAVRELHDAGLVRAGDPDQVVRNTMTDHLAAAVYAARLDLGAYDEQILEWLARGDLGPAQVVIGLIRRAHEAGRGAGRAGSVLGEVADERRRQDATWGEQNHPDGTGQWVHEQTSAMLAREACRKAAEDGTLTWAHVLREEVYEALAEDAPARVRAELVQVAAVAVAWIEAIDRREATR